MPPRSGAPLEPLSSGSLALSVAMGPGEPWLDRLEAELDVGRIKIVRGGHRLLNTRHKLEAAKLSEAEWRQRWEATRWFLQANGEADACWGNSTIRVHPTGEVDLVLPASLGYLANRPRRRYRLSCLAQFHHRGEEWATQIAVGAVAYAIWFSPERHRWYMDASWTKAPSPPVALENAAANGVVAVDFNADQLACWILDVAGNPTGKHPVSRSTSPGRAFAGTRSFVMRSAGSSALLELRTSVRSPSRISDSTGRPDRVSAMAGVGQV